MRPRTLRVMTWNIRTLRDDAQAVARVLRDAAPDVVCLQEAPRLPGSRWRLRSLARDAELRYVAGGRSGAGTAMLCSRAADVSDAQAFTFPGAGFGGRTRGAVLATVAVPGTTGATIRLACIHLGLVAEERLRHVRDLTARLSLAGRPVVVAGDLNEPPGGPSWQALAAVAHDPAPGAGSTFPAIKPRLRIDAILTGEGVLTVEYARWQPDPRDATVASDHLPLVSLLRLG